MGLWGFVENRNKQHVGSTACGRCSVEGSSVFPAPTQLNHVDWQKSNQIPAKELCCPPCWAVHSSQAH